MPKKSDWASLYGVKRKATDKALCEAAERAIEAEERAQAHARELHTLQNAKRVELDRLTGINLRTI
jgi:hypothetical protein